MTSSAALAGGTCAFGGVGVDGNGELRRVAFGNAPRALLPPRTLSSSFALFHV